ncbi:sensor histidine kinase [Streptomyces sp. NRRL F-5126]|uniref:sensor histidine kinase n=1 Tax=Streptomyces sp. NRRL F-5126 TaxID=1463857 RepID=UPI0004C7437C|nr:histidine kinase [Streptomyces sp. NRRL F-5126]
MRVARGLVDGLREDLFTDVFAYRPLRPLRLDGPVSRHVPRSLRGYAVWTPHALVLFAALVVLLIGMAGSGPLRVVTALLPAVAVCLTLVRPTLAWWVSVAETLVFGLAGAGTYGMDTFLASALAGHLVVMTVVAARTRPRTALWMWGLTAAYGMLSSAVTGYYGGMGPILVLSAMALLAVAVVQVRASARHEVAVQQGVTAVERGRRTLLEERTNIARELHDVVAHHMSVVAIQAEAAPYRVENPPPELEQAFVTIRENAVAALTELRRVLGVVRAADYQAPDAPQPTLADLDGLLANVREAGLDVEKAVTGAVRTLPQGVELSAYRIVQEALSNALRHAPGSTARVEIGYVLGGLGLRVVNTAPQGLVKPSPGAGHGLTGMRERVAMLDGEMSTGGTQDGGYEVAAFLPVPARDGAGE